MIVFPVKNPLIVYNVSYLILAWFCVYITPDNHYWTHIEGGKLYRYDIAIIFDLSGLLVLLTYALYFTLSFNVKKGNIPALIILPILLYVSSNFTWQFLLTFAHRPSILELKYLLAGIYCMLSCSAEIRLFKISFKNRKTF